jgi:uncharacterized protein with ParB-like and HNH nuclease domain
MAKFNDIPQFSQSPSYHINTGMDYLLQTIDRYVEEYGLQLNPDFQRPHVWSEDKQIAYIEFLLRGGQLSRDFKFNMPRWMSWKNSDFDNWTDETCMVLVDGKQRLESIRLFMNNELPAFGHTLNEYEDDFVLSRIWFDIYINDLPTRKDVLQWYIDLNSGGVVHTDEEIEKVQKMLEEYD